MVNVCWYPLTMVPITQSHGHPKVGQQQPFWRGSYCIHGGVGLPTRGERIVFWRPNTNTNIIRFPKTDRIRIQILFGFPKLTEYEYEYYSVSQKWSNTNTNIIWLPTNDPIRIKISFCFPIMTEYKYHLASQKWSNSINKCKFCWASQKESLQDQFWVLQGDAKFAESSDDWGQFQFHVPIYLGFGPTHQKYQCSAKYI